MEHQADVHPQLRLILPDAGPGCEKNGRRATWAVTTRSGRHQVPVAVLPTAKSLSAFSLKPQSDRLLGVLNEPNLDSHRCVPDGTDRSASHTQLTTIAQSEQETATPALIVSTPAHNQQSPMSDMVAPLRKTIRKRNKAHLNIRRSAAPPDLPSLTLRCPSSQICSAAIVGAQGQRRIHRAALPRPLSTTASLRQRGRVVG